MQAKMQWLQDPNQCIKFDVGSEADISGTKARNIR
jgi:hypothetical protein